MTFNDPLIHPVLDLGAAKPGVRSRAVQQFIRRLSTPGFLDTLRQNRLTPLLYHTMTQLSRQEVGEVPHLDELRRDYLAVLRLYTIQERETRHVLQVLGDAGVEAVVLKGADICQRLYGNPVCRPMSDVDVLIPPSDREKAQDALCRSGYTRMPRDLDLRPGFNARFGWEEMYASARSAEFWVDLHWEIQEMGTLYRLPYEALRARAQPSMIGSLPVLVLCPEHLLLHLGVHTLDEWENAPLLKIVDLERILTRLPLDWDLFLAEAAAFRAQGPMRWVLQEMARFCPDTIPGYVLEELAAYRPLWAEELILRRPAAGFPLAMVLSLWRHQPVRAWLTFLRGKLWPETAYLKANAPDIDSRSKYLRNLLKRSQDRA